MGLNKNKEYEFRIKVENKDILTYHHVIDKVTKKIFATFFAGVFITEDEDKAMKLKEYGYKEYKTEQDVKDLSDLDIKPISIVPPTIKSITDVEKLNKGEDLNKPNYIDLS